MSGCGRRVPSFTSIWYSETPVLDRSVTEIYAEWNSSHPTIQPCHRPIDSSNSATVNSIGHHRLSIVTRYYQQHQKYDSRAGGDHLCFFHLSGGRLIQQIHQPQPGSMWERTNKKLSERGRMFPRIRMAKLSMIAHPRGIYHQIDPSQTKLPLQ